MVRLVQLGRLHQLQHGDESIRLSNLLRLESLTNLILILKIRNLNISKVGYVFRIHVISMLPHEEFGRNDHREDALHCTCIFKVPDVSDKTEMDVRVVELIEFPPTELTISNIFRGSF